MSGLEQQGILQSEGPPVRVLKTRQFDELLTIKIRKAAKGPGAEAINPPSGKGDPPAQRQFGGNPRRHLTANAMV